MTKPAVLFVDHAGVLGGAELYLLDVARHYRARSRVVVFEEGPFPARLRAEGIAVEVLQAPRALLGVKKQGGFVQALRALPALLSLVLRLVRTARACDVVYANSQKALLVAGLAGRLAGKPVIWNLHDIMTAEHFSSLNRRVAVGFANVFATRVLVNSEATKEAFAESGGRVEKAYVVHNGIDATPFRALAPAARARLRAELGVGEAPVVGVFSRLAPWKGQHVLLDALPRLPGLHAVLVGDALFGEDDRYAAGLRAQVDRLGLADRVHFLGFRSDVPALLQAVDIVAHTSTAPEPFGRVIVEGMLADRPVVAARAGGALEIIEDARTGLLVAPGDASLLAEALGRLLALPEEARGLAREGRRAALERFSIETMLQRIDGHIRAVAPHPVPTR